MSEEKKISERYRELPREEPPRALDDAILAASRRAVHARPAPLVGPGGRSRWYFPLAAAAVIVLAVAVTVHVDRERPDAEVVSGPVAMKEEATRQEEVTRQPEAPKPAPPVAPAPAPARKAAPQVFAPDPKPEAAAPALGAASSQNRDGALDTAQAKAAAEAERREAATQGMRRADEAPRASSTLAKVTAERSPEQWLQGIADLRRQGRHDEADKALAEFRKRYPDYKISEAMLEKVERSRAR